MPTKIFDTGNLNVAGVCHAICCQWINASKKKGNVTSLSDLGSPMAMFMNWQLTSTEGNPWPSINDKYHLPPVTVKQHPILNGQWLAQQATTGTGYGLIILWGGGIDVNRGAHALMGHTVAVRKDSDHVQYFDPNDGASSFTNSMELYNWLPNELVTKYPDLTNRQCEFARV